MIILDWDDDKGEGIVVIDNEFQEEHFVLKLDALSDWIFVLQAEYDKILSNPK